MDSFHQARLSRPSYGRAFAEVMRQTDHPKLREALRFVFVGGCALGEVEREAGSGPFGAKFLEARARTVGGVSTGDPATAEALRWAFDGGYAVCWKESAPEASASVEAARFENIDYAHALGGSLAEAPEPERAEVRETFLDGCARGESAARLFHGRTEDDFAAVGCLVAGAFASTRGQNVSYADCGDAAEMNAIVKAINPDPLSFRQDSAGFAFRAGFHVCWRQDTDLRGRSTEVVPAVMRGCRKKLSQLALAANEEERFATACSDFAKRLCD